MKERQAKILKILVDEKRVEVARLSELLDVSRVTIRKDLADLEKKGLLVKEHGFARINEQDDINNRLAYNYEIKSSIAKKASEIVDDGETIMVESGSSCALLALEIARTKKDVTLITNSAFIADYVRKTGDIKIILLGGEYQKESQVLVGPITRNSAQAFFVDKLFIGIDGINKDMGFSGNDYMRCETVRDLSKQAKNVIIVSDSSKFKRTGVVNLIGFDKVKCLYTDNKISRECEDFLKDKDIEVVKTGA